MFSYQLEAAFLSYSVKIGADFHVVGPRCQILSSMGLVSLVSKYIQQIADFLKAIMGPGNRTQTWATFHSQEIK